MQRLTNTPGYDGGAFYSPDCSEIVWRASRPEGAELDEYRRSSTQGLVRPSALEIYLMNADGTGTRAGSRTTAPPTSARTSIADGKRIIYSSNVGSEVGPRVRPLADRQARRRAPERVTTAPGFDGFPHFSPDGRWMVWASNRADPESHETNLFIARWAD